MMAINRQITIQTNSLVDALDRLVQMHGDSNPLNEEFSKLLHTQICGVNIAETVSQDNNVPKYLKDFFYDHFDCNQKTLSNVFYRLNHIQNIISTVMTEVAVKSK